VLGDSAWDRGAFCDEISADPRTGAGVAYVRLEAAPETFMSLRWGELCALRKSDIDMDARTVRVQRSLTELQNGALAFGPPKSDAGRRTVGFPELIAPVVREHLSRFARPEDDGLVFTGPAGALLRRGNFRRRTWLPALRKAGLPAAHFHDLRHTGNNLTATAGANLRELMARMGHSSTRAALIYLKSRELHQPGEKPQVARSARHGSRRRSAIAATS